MFKIRNSKICEHCTDNIPDNYIDAKWKSSGFLTDSNNLSRLLPHCVYSVT